MLMLLQVDDTGDNERLVNDAGGGGGSSHENTFWQYVLLRQRWRNTSTGVAQFVCWERDCGVVLADIHEVMSSQG